MSARKSQTNRWCCLAISPPGITLTSLTCSQKVLRRSLSFARGEDDQMIESFFKTGVADDQVAGHSKLQISLTLWNFCAPAMSAIHSLISTMSREICTRMLCFVLLWLNYQCLVMYVINLLILLWADLPTLEQSHGSAIEGTTNPIRGLWITIKPSKAKGVG